MTWFEWFVLAGGLALGYALVSMLMGEQATRKARAAAAKSSARETPPDEPAHPPPAHDR